MIERKELILNIIIKEHIRSGEPIASGLVVEKHKLQVSPATVRNEMAELEEEGYIIQPHTSAGRVPTEKAYLKYLSRLEAKKPVLEIARELDNALEAKDENGFKQTAKILAKRSQNAVFWAFHRHNLYYTGLSNLFSQPEFSQANLIYDISGVIDRLDEIINAIYERLPSEPQVLIGSQSPFGDFCATIMARYHSNEHSGLIGILGPMRMDYERNLGLVRYVRERLK